MYENKISTLIEGLAVFSKVTSITDFSEITVNGYGNYVVKTKDKQTFIINSNDYAVYRLEGGWKDGKWVAVK